MTSGVTFFELGASDLKTSANGFVLKYGTGCNCPKNLGFQVRAKSFVVFMHDGFRVTGPKGDLTWVLQMLEPVADRRMTESIVNAGRSFGRIADSIQTFQRTTRTFRD